MMFILNDGIRPGSDQGGAEDSERNCSLPTFISGMREPSARSTFTTRAIPDPDNIVDGPYPA